MGIDLNLPEPPSREQRLGSITGYDGTLRDLTSQGCSGCLQNKERAFQTVSLCSHQSALSQISGLQDTLIVDHAPIGCAGSAVHYSPNKAMLRPLPDGSYVERAPNISTNLKEADTIFGALDKLKDTIRAAYERHHPKEIYVATSCVSAIIGEDVYSAVQEMKEELEIPVELAGAEGLRSKIWASGFDSYSHAVAKVRIKPPAEKKNTVNYVGFAPVGRDRYDELFGKFGLEMICLTAGGSIEDFERASASQFSFGQCSSQSNYIGGVLEQEYGVKYFHNHQPNGGIGFERFIRDIGAYLGKEDIAEEVIEEEKAEYLDKIEPIIEKLKDKKAVVAMGSGYSYEGARMLTELGVEVLHAVAYHYDPVVEMGNVKEDVSAVTDVREIGLDFNVSVNDAQEMENNLIVLNNKPDFVLSRAHGTSSWAARLGIPSMDMGIGLNLLGYRGLYHLGSALVVTLKNNNFVRKIGEHNQSPFTEEYLNSKPNNFYQEAGF